MVLGDSGRDPLNGRKQTLTVQHDVEAQYAF